MEHRRRNLSTIRYILVPAKLIDDTSPLVLTGIFDRSFKKWDICTYMIGRYAFHALCHLLL
jgi:hypothetical protein